MMINTLSRRLFTLIRRISLPIYTNVNLMPPLASFTVHNHLNCTIRSLYNEHSNDGDLQKSQKTDVTDDIDIESLFMDERVQNILHRITGFDAEKIFAPKKLKKLISPKYKFLTERELKFALEDSRIRGREKLQMPPVMRQRSESECEVMSKDPEIQGFVKHKLIFVDGSMGYNDRNRLIVVREKNGLLRKANMEERYRMNQCFFPISKREYEMPNMFKDENLPEVLNRKDYLFILDRSCLQFEADDPIYIKVTHTTYDHIAETRSFDQLRSTRHFGPMTFYYAIHKKIDGLLLDSIQRELINDASDMIRLFFIIHPSEQFNDLLNNSNDSLSIIKFYINHDAIKRPQIELAIQTYEQILKERNEFKEEIQKAHGISN